MTCLEICPKVSRLGSNWISYQLLDPHSIIDSTQYKLNTNNYEECQYTEHDISSFSSIFAMRCSVRHNTHINFDLVAR